MSDGRRVVVTGIGILTPLGIGLEKNWDALIHGRSGIGLLTAFDASGYPTRIAGQVKGFDPEEMIGPWPDIEVLGLHTQYALAAARLAHVDAGLETGRMNPLRVGVYLGCGEGDMNFLWLADRIAESLNGGFLDMRRFLNRGSAMLNPKKDIEYEPNKPVYHIANAYGAWGPNSNCLTACAASAQAIGEAACTIVRGDADVMYAGGAHSMIHPMGLAGFNLLTAISMRNDEPEKASRPFDLHRDGFVLSEGAGILILEEEEHARRRGARVYGRILGFGCSSDAYRITDVHPDGRGAAQAMQNALADAGVAPDAVGYINAHGTSTQINDRVETAAIKKVFGAHSADLPVSSTKSMMGHLIAAAGAVEAAVCLLAIGRGIIPPTINYEFPDPECDLDYVPNIARESRIDIALSNSFGFGGQNVCLVLARDGGPSA
ncbi:MAG: beta-ketoacyl-ACP synthase II [Candidatus Aureabacteria bacterium]|nr:beta-ketoacyl-ACP synthase II [Candidatus Auribacterota bacterium]